MSSLPDHPQEYKAVTRSKDWRFLLRLFQETLRISTFTIGGGFIIIAFLQERFVEKLHWLNEDEMMNLVSIAQSSPGPVAINTAVLTGYKLAGLTGAFCAVLGTSLPPLIIITVIAYCYNWIADNKSLQAFFYGARYAEAALIANVTVNMTKTVFKTSGLTGLAMGILAASIIMTAANSVIYVVAIFAAVGFIFSAVLCPKLRRQKLFGNRVEK
ncbi:MAG: chromate transporter [Candidatus Bruticola sp.]